MTPLAQLMRVAPVAMASQSHPTHWMMPAALSATWPPTNTRPGVSTLPSNSLLVLPAVTWHTPVAGAVSVRHWTISAGAPEEDEEDPVITELLPPLLLFTAEELLTAEEPPPLLDNTPLLLLDDDDGEPLDDEDEVSPVVDGQPANSPASITPTPDFSARTTTSRSMEPSRPGGRTGSVP